MVSIEHTHSPTADPALNDVADTSIWVAHHRALETERSDALFCDPMAKKLSGERGHAIDSSLSKLRDNVRFQVVTRTLIIDRFIADLVKAGVDIVLNLGAGLDARPYRLNVPSTLMWIEVDFPRVIEYKSELLKDEKPFTQLERIPLDLTSREERRKLFARIGASAKKVAVLTEGVLPYLTEQQVAELASDLHAQPTFRFWIAEYHSPLIYRFMKSSAHNEAMKNTKFEFMPKNWNQFFVENQWSNRRVEFLIEESLRVGRPLPVLGKASGVLRLLPRILTRPVREMAGIAIYEPA